MILLMGLLAALLSFGSSAAVVESLEFNSRQEEARYRLLVNEFRCLVCQNQTVADSNADLANDLRKITYNMIQGGSSDTEIRGYMVDRYGEFVLYKPPFSAATVVIWLGPFILLLVTLTISLTFIRKRNNRPSSPAPNDEALQRVQKLLAAEQTDAPRRG
jgi:cytochrome c-type biogenesis protein CcmH